MWQIIMVLLFLAEIVAFIYLAGRISKFDFVRRISHGNKKIGIAFCLAILLLLFIGVWLLIGYMNAVICILHVVAFSFIFEGIFWLVGKIRRKKVKQYYAGIAAVVFSVGYLAAGWYLAHDVRQTSYTIRTEKMAGNLRIILFSDSHIGTTFDGEEFLDYVNEMQEKQPDVVVITGDFVDDDTSKEDMVAACSALGTLKTTYGVYYAFGNHDKGYYDSAYRGYDGEDLIAELEKNQVIVLQDESRLIDERFYMIGRKDLSEEAEFGGRRAAMSELTEQLDMDKFTIVLDHQPCDYENQGKAGVDLVLSGHTHGGQLFPLAFTSKLVSGNENIYGYEKRGNTNFIVTSGISDWAIRFKTGCKSEYVVIDIKGR